MFGAIIPEPLQIPATVNPSALTRACFGTVSVVIMARAAASSAAAECARFGATAAVWRRIKSRSKYLPITPVLATPQFISSMPKASAPICAMVFASSNPRFPVYAFAHPLLTITPSNFPRRVLSAIRLTTGALTRFLVKTAAPVPDARINARPYFPSLTPAASTPSTAQMLFIISLMGTFPAF